MHAAAVRGCDRDGALDTGMQPDAANSPEPLLVGNPEQRQLQPVQRVRRVDDFDRINGKVRDA